MANITVDIQARVTGYQKSLSDLQSQIQKLDPGASISKNVTKAFEQASNEVKGLSKNMFPKASSDTQIDSIIEKTNRAGEAIQRVATLLQSVQVSDLNLGSFGGDIETFKNQIASLQTELDSKLSAGIVKAVGESEQLKSVFKELGTDLSKATGATLLEDLSKGAQKAADNVTDLEKKLEKTQTSINNYQIIDNVLKSSKLGTLEGRTALDDELKTITGNYDAVIEQLRATMISGFSKLKTDTKLDTDGLLKIFFSDLTPENVQSHIQNLFNTLSSQGVFGENEKRKFYEAIFGGNNEYNTNNINFLTKSIGLDKAHEQYKAQLQEFYQKIVKDIDGKDQAQINRLIGENQLDKAVSATTKALDNAYSKIYNNIKQNQEKLNNALSDKDNIVLQLNAARQTQNTFNSAEQQLRQEIEVVRQENKNLENQIVQLREQLNQRLSGEAGNIRNTGATENRNIGQGFRESLEISEAYKNQLAQVAAKEQALGKLQGVVQRWFSIYAAIRMVRQAIDSVISTIKELDTTITEIAIVTSMDQSELWDQMPQYTQLARDYAASISGVYQVSQLYYQQGLQTADVMALTEQTLKMARISGLDYAQATDYMTNAVRSFKMEMTDAQRVVDVYSSIAASSATSVTELASAMSKTASSAQAVGSSFENTTAMMAVMIEATRESAENIGSAMKSIISRYGEMTSDPSKLVDSEGQEMSLNRVDKALQTVGISIHNAAGEFRNFDDVIMELAEKWDTIDTNTQRYIATIMAGNRQQSRFLALVSSYDRLKELSADAAESEDASQLQFLKTLDSVEAKTQQLQTNIQSLYTSSGLEDFYKTILDIGVNITETFDELGSQNGLFAVISKIGGTFGALATLVTHVFNTIKANYSMVSAEITAKAKVAAAEKAQAEINMQPKYIEIYNEKESAYEVILNKEVIAAQEAAAKKVQAEKEAVKQQEALRKELAYQNRWQTRGMAATALGLTASTIAASMDTSTQRGGKAALTGVGGIASGIGTGMMLWQTSPIAAILMGLASALPSVLEAFNILNVSISEKVSQMQEDLTSKSDEKIKSKDTFKTLESYKQKWDELNASQYESNEKREEFLQLNNDIAASYPELISRMNEEGNYIVNMAEGYKQLAEAKREAYKGDLIKAAAQDVSNYEDSDYLLKQVYNTAPLENQKSGFFNLNLDSYEGLLNIDYLQEDFANDVQQIFSTRGATNANMRTAERLFGGENKDLSILSSTLTDEDIYLTKESESILNQLYLAFIEQIKSGVDQVTAEANIISSGEFDSKYNELIKNFDTEFYTQLQKYLNISNFSDTLSDNKMSTYMTEYIDILSGSVEDMGIESNQIQKRYMKERLLDAWKNSDDKKIFDVETDIEERKKIIEDFFNKHGNAWYYATFTNQEDVISTLTKEQNEFYENLGKYTLEEIEKMFPDDATMESIFHKDYDDIIKNYTEWYNKSNVLFDTITNFSQLFGPEYLSQIQGNYQKIINSTGSNAVKNDRLNALDNIYNSINQANLTSEQQNMVLEKVISSDLFSLTGISNLIGTLNDIEGINFDVEGANIKDSILKFKDFITINLNTEINSVLESYSEGLQSLSDSLSKASKGMNLKEAVKAANELDLTLADFNQNSDKFYIKDLTVLKDHYIKINKEQKDDIQKQIDEQKILYENLEAGQKIGSIDYFDFEQYENLSDEERKIYYDANSKLLEPLIGKAGISQTMATSFEYFNKVVNKYREGTTAYLTKLSQETVKEKQTSFNLNELLASTSDFSEIEKIIDEQYADLLTESNIDVSTLKNDIKSYLKAKTDKSFSEYIAETAGEQVAKVYEASEEAVNYLLASTAISQGNLDSLLDLVFGKEGTEGAIEIDREAIKNQIAIGETDNLPKELQKYFTLIQDTFKSVRETTVNALISAVGDGSTQIKVTDLNKGILEQFKENGWITGDIQIDKYVTIAAENLLNSAEDFRKVIISSFDTEADQIKALTEYHNNQYAKSNIGELQKIAGESSMAYEDILNYFTSIGWSVQDITDGFIREQGLDFDSTGQVIISNYTTWIEKIETTVDEIIASNVSEKEKNLARTLLAQTRDLHASEQRTAIDGVIDNYNKVTDEQIQALADSLNVSTEFLLKYFSSRKADGTYDFKAVDFNKDIQNGVIAVEDGVIAVEDGVKDYLQSTLSNVIDNYTESISKIQKYTKSGTTSRAEMETFAQQFKEVTGNAVDIDKAFEYDSEIKAWKLGSDYLIRYAYARGQQLGMIDDEYKKYVDDLLKEDVTQSVQQAIEGLTSGKKDARKQLEESIVNYYANLFNADKDALNAAKKEFSETPEPAKKDTSVVIGPIVEKKVVEYWGKALTSAKNVVGAEQELAESTNESLEGTAEELTTIAELIQKSAQRDIDNILKGGIDAVKTYQKYNENASQEELEEVFYSRINALNSVVDQVNDLMVGQFVGTEGKLFEVLFRAGAVENGVVQAGFDMVEVYAAIYAEMQTAAGHTTAGLNAVYAKLLTAQDQQNIDIIDALSNAEGMTYDALGEILAKYSNQTLEQFVKEASNNGIERRGFGKIRITDWETFAKAAFNVEDLNAISNTEEYISAFKAYNDGLISMNQQVEKNIIQEIKQIGDAKPGDWLNVSQLYQTLGEELSEQLAEELSTEGAYLDKGILKLSEDVNLLQISQILQSMIDATDITEGVEEVHDLVLQVLKSYAEAITKGIQGGLSNVERQDLINKASDLGISIDFTETADGFKLVETSTIDLYYALKNIDSLHAGQIFDALREELEGTRDEFKSVAQLTEHITKIRDGTYAADEKISNARKEQYEAELQIAEEILAVRSATEDDSFKFMEQDIPSGQNNPLNYWNNWKTAFDSIKEGKRTGKMDYKDFYNLITEMGHLSDMMGGKGIQIGKDLEVSSENVAELITKAGKNMQVAKDGSLKVNLKGIGVDFAASAADMQAGVDEGIDTLAKSQISMLDGVIQVLETIVAMEKLGDLDTDNDMKITLPELLLDKNGNQDGTLDETTGYITKYGSNYDTIRKTLISTFANSSNEDLQKAYENVKYHGYSIKDILNATEEQLQDMNITGKDLAKLVDGLWQLSISDGWDIDNPVQSLYQLISQIDDFALSVDQGTHSISMGSDGLEFSIDWDSEAIKNKIVKAAKAAGIEAGKTPEEIIEAAKAALTDVEKDEPITLDQNYLLKIANGDIKVEYDDEDKPKSWIVGNQKFNSYEDSVIASDLYKATGKQITQTEIKGGKASVVVKKGETNITVESTGEGANWIDPNTSVSYETWDALQDAWFKNSDEYKALTEPTEQELEAAKKKWKVKMGFEVAPTIEGSLENVPAEQVKNIQTNIQSALENGDWESVKVAASDLGIELNFDKNGPTFSQQQEILDFFGLKDTTTLSNAITQAFSSLPTMLEGLDAQPAKDVAEAIQQISTNATTALTEVSNLVAELEKLNTLQLPSNSDNSNVPEPGKEKLTAKQYADKYGKGTIASGGLSDVSGGAKTSAENTVTDSSTTYTVKADKVQIDASGASASIVPGTRVKVADDSKVDIENSIMGVPSSLDPLDMTYIPKDLGQQQVPTGMSMTITNPIKAKVTTIEPILEEAEIKAEGETIEIPVELNADNLINDAENVGANVSDAVANGIRSGESNIQNAIGSIETHIRELNTMATDVFEKLRTLLQSIQGHVSITGDVTLETPFGTLSSTSGVKATNGKITLSVEGIEKVEAAKESIGKPVSFTVTAVDLASSTIAKIANNLSKLTSKTIEITTNYTTTGRPPKTNGMTELPKAAGNIGLAQAKGTLMGELGPELVVSNGRYFVAGQNGAEMVDLADDAIVFNHLQTEQLLKHGMSSGRGRAVTSERNAVAFAQGNVDGGPAMASASAALNALKQLRAMWESLLGASVSDLGKGGGGGGGGSKVIDPKAWIDTVERWYNLMQEIARLEQQITHEEKLRAKLQSDFQKNGKAYYTSQKLSLDSLEQQIQAQEQLNLSREDYLDRRVAALKENSFGKIYQFDPETNQLEFRKDTNLNGFTNAMEFLTDLYGFNEQGKANYTNKQKYEILKANGFGEQMLYKDGMEIKADSDNSGDISDEEWESFYEQATEAFRDRMDEYAQATQSLRDEIQKGKDQLLELQTQVNEILQDMRDNQMDVENKVLDAIVDLREREIDALQDERDKLEESVNKYVDGLSNALDKEQKMYQNQESQNDLDKQRRRLAILQRSGGSASDIANLQNDINQSERDMYFDLQQQQIDAIQEASQLELERMDTQIEIMNETLEFQKEYGLLWEAVYDVMGGSAAQITDFISGNSEFWSQSPLATSTKVNEIFFGAEQWTSYRDNIEDWNKVRDALFNQIKAADKKLYDTSMRQEFGENYDPNGKYAQIFEESYNKYGDVTKASTAARSAYTADKLAAEQAKRAQEEAENAAKAQQIQTTATADNNNNNNNQPVSVRFTSYEHNAGYHWRYSVYSDGSRNKINYGPHSLNANGVCTICGCKTNKTSDKKKLQAGKIPTAASGGYVNHGIYELGERGTETVLTASQTKVLRDNILSNRPSSLISLLKTYNEGFSQNHFDAYGKEIQTLYNNTSNDSGITIENATVNMNVQQLANDYDAKRAGEQALAEIMRIARKTSANNSIRR